MISFFKRNNLLKAYIASLKLKGKTRNLILDSTVFHNAVAYVAVSRFRIHNSIYRRWDNKSRNFNKLQQQFKINIKVCA